MSTYTYFPRKRHQYLTKLNWPKYHGTDMVYRYGKNQTCFNLKMFQRSFGSQYEL